MATVKEIFAYFESIIPTKMKMGTDNPGFLVGNGAREVHKILLALDITDDVISEAVEYGADLIVSHHPLFFSVSDASTETLIGRKIVSILEAKMSAICLHTNLDSAKDGVNDTLMTVLGAENEGILDPYGAYADGTSYGLGRFGTVRECTLDEFLKHCKTVLQCNGLRYISGGKPVHKIAVCGGSGSSMLNVVAERNCDTYVTADVKHNGFLDAKELGINLIDAGHYSTENVVIPVLENMLNGAFPSIQTKISVVHTQPEQYYV